MKEFLQQLYLSLDSLTVKGRENMDILLGCMIAIESKIAEINASTESEGENG